MDIRANSYSLLRFLTPREILIKMRQIETDLPPQMDSKTRALRTNRLKPEREMREASLFCFGIEQKLGVTVEFSLVEDQDFDFVARVKTDDTEH